MLARVYKTKSAFCKILHPSIMPKTVRYIKQLLDLTTLREKLKTLHSSGSVFTNYSQEHSLSFSPRFVTLNVTQLLIG